MSYSLKEPFLAKVKSKEFLGSKKVCHLILDIKGSSITYAPGDSVAIIPQNDSEEVEKTISHLRAPKNAKIKHYKNNQEISLKEFLLNHANISKIPSILSPSNQNQYHLWDFLKQHPSSLSYTDICTHLSPLRPRFYSIASAQKAHLDEIHIIVVPFLYESNNIQRKGVASHFLCDTVEENNTIPIYIHHTRNFIIPPQEKDLIMIATGTGIAPFIAFLQERSSIKTNSKNILFFGEREKTNIYFSSFLNSLEKQNFLKLILALSREAPKAYVQDKLIEYQKEIIDLLDHGAYLYLCGSAGKMAKDVHITLINIIKAQKHLNDLHAEQYLKELISQKRYLKEVY
jgi:sulfite reductase (NADPH) flavoprotein alpha-component